MSTSDKVAILWVGFFDESKGAKEMGTQDPHDEKFLRENVGPSTRMVLYTCVFAEDTIDSQILNIMMPVGSARVSSENRIVRACLLIVG